VNAKLPLAGTRFLVGAAAVVSALFAGRVVAEEKIVTISVQVSSKGLDLSQPVDAQRFYTRLKNAAYSVCTRGTRPDLLPVLHLPDCYEKALGNAVHASNSPTITRIYLETHTPREAAAHGIDLHAQVAAK
jgi:UrcA family protein